MITLGLFLLLPVFASGASVFFGSLFCRKEQVMNKMPEIEICFKILCSIPESYDALTMTILQSKAENMTLSDLRTAFSMELSRNPHKKHSIRDEALILDKQNWHKNPCYLCGLNNHHQATCRASASVVPSWTDRAPSIRPAPRKKPCRL